MIPCLPKRSLNLGRGTSLLQPGMACSKHSSRMVLFQVRPNLVLISSAPNRWADVFGPEDGQYDRYGYNVIEDRWAYDLEPPASERIKRPGRFEEARTRLQRAIEIDRELRRAALDDPDLEPLWTRLASPNKLLHKVPF